MRRLIVNADDFGLTQGINQGIAALHQANSLTSATLMAVSPRFADAIALARLNPSLGIGCHIVLVDGFPTADPETIQTLIVPKKDSYRSEFRQTLGRFVRDLLCGRIQRDHIEREAIAQIRRLQSAGIAVTHVDTHKHTHMFPAVLDAVTRAAKACGVAAIRNPFEPNWSVAATAQAGRWRKFQVQMLSRYRENFLRVVRERDLATTDGCLGILATGTLDEGTLRSILERMPEGTWELVCHPAYMDGELRAAHTRLQESRVIELSALESLPEILAGMSHRTETIHFGELLSRDASATFTSSSASVSRVIPQKVDPL